MKQQRTLNRRLLYSLLGLVMLLGFSQQGHAQTILGGTVNISPSSEEQDGSISAGNPLNITVSSAIDRGTSNASLVAEICNNGIDDDGDGLVDFYDPDCSSNDNYYGLPTPACNADITGSEFSIRGQFSTSRSVRIAVYNTPVAGDIDGDGVTELLIMANDSISSATGRPTKNIRVFSGLDGTLERTIITPYLGWSTTGSLGIADVDGDGLGEIFVLTSGSSINMDPSDRGVIICYEDDGTLKWKSNSPGGYQQLDFSSSINFADFNGDGNPEVYTYSKIFNAQTGVLLAEGGAGNNTGRSAVLSFGNSANSFAADIIPGNPGLELIAGNQVFSVDITNPNGISGNTMLVATTAQNQAVDGFTAVADMDLDGDLDIVSTELVGDTSVLLTISDGQTNALIAPILQIPSAALVGIHSIGDIDGDCEPEILMVTSGHLYAFELIGGAIVEKWDLITTDGSGATGQTLFDFNQDGVAEIVYRDESRIRVIRGDSGIDLASFPCRSATGYENPIVVDIDNDNQAEIISTCGTSGSGTQGVIVTYRTGGDPWAPARSVWNQKSYQPVAVNDDLSIPISQQDHSLSTTNASCGCNGVNRPLNNFMVQSTFLDGQGCPVNPVADVVLEMDSAVCNNAFSGKLYYRVSNIGSFKFPAGSSVTIYRTNPTTTNASVLNTFQLAQDILPGQSLLDSTTLNIGGLLSSTLFGVVNDHTGGSRPYDLANDFPFTGIPECDYTNNIDSLYFVECCPASLGLTEVITDISCPGANDAAIDISVTNGTAPYTYFWADGSTLEDRTGLPPGWIFVDIRDSIGCREFKVYTIDPGVDTTAPVVNCQNITLSLDANGSATLSESDIDAGSFDQCSSISLSISDSIFDCQQLGANSTTLTAVDSFGNASTCTAQVTVEDNTAPTALCQDITLTLNSSGFAVINVNDIDAGSFDNCGIASVEIDADTFSCVQGNNSSVTLTATDLSGNTASCTANVTILDTDAPTALCQDITVSLDANGNATISGADIDGGSSDNCAIASMSASPSSFDCTQLGPNPVTLTVTDANGNASTCTAQVTIEDNTAPTALCQDITVHVNASGFALVSASDIDAGSSDNCSIASISTDAYAYGCGNVGPNTATLTVTDASGNAANCTAQITVLDTIPPNFNCVNTTVYLDGTGNVSINATDLVTNLSDNCGSVICRCDSSTTLDLDCSDLRTFSQVVIVTDVNGNTASCTTMITVEDSTNSACCPSPMDFETDDQGNNLAAGTIITNQYIAQGVQVTAVNNNGPDVAIVFDSSNPTGGDTDLGTPNQQYGGPGVGNGGSSNSAPENNILIIAENVTDANNDGLIDNPDDDANGGQLIFEFTNRAATIETVRLIDLDDGPWNIVLELLGGGTTIVPVPTSGDNSALTVPVFESNVHRMRIELGGSGGVGGFAWCPNGQPIPSNSRSANSGEDAGSSPASGLEPMSNLNVFPNPFTEGAQLQFSIDHNSSVNLKVYDLRGIEVATLFEGAVQKGELNTVEFKPHNIAKGIYFARLTTEDGKLMVRKLIYK